jgi:hypothetical protein
VASETQINELISRLEKLTSAMEKGSSGSGKPGERQPRDPGRAGGFHSLRDEAKESAEATADEVKNLENKKRALGQLAPEQEQQLKLLREELEIKERMGNAKSWKQYEEERLALIELTEAREDATEAQNKYNQEVEVGATKAQQLTSEVMKVDGAFLSIAKVIPLSTRELKGFGKGMAELFTSGALFKAAASEIFNAAYAVADAGAEFTKMTGAADAHRGVITGVRNEYRHLGVDASAAGSAAADLYTNFQDFTTLSKDQKTELVGQAAILENLGVSAASTGQIFDQATKSLGFSAGELVGLTEHLHSTAQSIGKSTEQVFQDFAAVSKQLAFYGTDVVDVFDKLSKQSKATGLTVSELVSISGDAFNTFDGAAQKVGRLNAILGGPYLNSIDMLNASEADRIEMLKESMDASGQMFSELNKYEQLAIADSLGVDVDTARRMFGELSAAEEMQIKQQEEIAETSKKAMKQAEKLTAAFKSLFVALEPLSDAIVMFTDALTWFISSKAGKVVMGIAVLISGIFLLKKALTGLGAAGGATVGALKALRNPIDTIKNAFTGAAGGGGADTEASSAMMEAPDDANTGRWKSFTEGVKELGEAAKGTWKEMLAFGAAILMIGAGIAVAAYGLSYLVKSFENLTGEQILGALAALVIVGILFAGMLYILATASLSAVGPMLALGVAFLLIGAGIAIAAYGMSLLVGAFAELEGPQIWAAAAALIFFSIAIAAIIIAAVGATAAAPVILALAALLAAIGLAALLLGLGISIAARGMAVFVEAISKIPPKTLFQLALGIAALGAALILLAVGLYVAAAALVVMAVALVLTMPIIALSTFVLFGWALALVAVGIALVVVGYGLSQLVKNLLLIPPILILKTAAAFGVLGAALIVLAIGLVAAAIGFGLLAVSLLFAAPILLWSSIALGFFGASLIIVGIGMALVAKSTTALAAALTVLAKSMPALREFAGALKEIGSAAVGIALTAAALGALTLSLAPFGLAVLLLNRKKLEALTEFNKSATLTVDTVQKPAVPTDKIEATEARMKGAETAAVGGATVSKPVINFGQKSILVKIGDRELRDVVIEVLKDPAVGRAISGFGSG